jgi:hypothetical protein
VFPDVSLARVQARHLDAQPVIMIRKSGTHIAMVPAQHNTTAARLGIFVSPDVSCLMSGISTRGRPTLDAMVA